MGKTRVHELAKKLGLENKELLQKLEDAGIEASNHMSALDDEDVQKFEAAQTPQNVKIEEQRLNTGVIRRRKKAVAPKAEAEEAPKEIPTEEESAQEPPETAAEEPVSEPSEVTADQPPAEETADTTDEPVAETGEPEKEEPPAKPAKPAKTSPNQAKILGRVELPTPAERPARKSGKPGRADSPGRKKPSGRPAPAGNQVPPPGMVAPLPEKEGRGKKRKKGKERVDFGKGEQPRRRNRREVFEPERDGGRHRKHRKQSKPAKKTEITVSKAIKRIIKISDVITVGELAKRMGIKANDLIRELMNQGEMVTINHPLDFESASILAS
ncbi:MAG: translation initiation factor IF-2, partial [Desulfuromonadales bacterium]|nr:translation initiation factor IF-2 [Desulfuromonadales bacterium]